MKERRQAKISALLQRELSTLVNNDFGEEYGLITVLDVLVRSDFESARIYISVLNLATAPKLLNNLKTKAPFYQKILAEKLKLRSTPKIIFIFDPYQDKLDQVDKLLKEIDHGT